MADRDQLLVRFVDALRRDGLRVGTGSVVDFATAASLLRPAELYWAGRTTLIGRNADIETYDRVFARFFSGGAQRARVQVQPAVRVVPGGADVESSTELRPGPSEGEGAVAASDTERLREKRFASCTPQELARLRELMAELRFATPLRSTRRRRRSRRGSIDLRRTMRLAVRTGGDPIRIGATVRRERHRRLILLLDVSASMTGYSRALLTFAHAATRADQRCDAFCFGTRLTRVTRTLGAAEPDDALERAAAEVLDWDGGTRIGASLKDFLDRFGHAGMARGAVVVICSDGLDVGDPGLLAEQMSRLSRLAHSVIWANPLKADPRYEPRARGMSAALPWIDVFASGHNLASIERLVDVVALTRRVADTPGQAREPGPSIARRRGSP